MKTAFNINGYVRVKLTAHGLRLHREDHERLNARGMKLKYEGPKEDADGWSEWQLWHLMQTFGPHIFMGGEMPFDTEIIFNA